MLATLLTRLGKLAKPCLVRTNGKEIVRRRQELGWRQVDLSNESKVSQPWLCRIESGEYDGSPRVIKKLADALGCKVTDLILPEPEADVA